MFEDYTEYKKTFISKYRAPRVYYANVTLTVHNMPDSSNRFPKGNIGWINYWRAFSENTKDFVTCSCCGKCLSVHKELKPLHEAFARFIPEMKKYDYAEGGHIIVKGITGVEEGVYITPLCAECNNQFDKDIRIQPGSVFVEEVEPDIR